MTVNLGDYGEGLKLAKTWLTNFAESDCDVAFSRSLENARKPKSMMKK